MYFREFLCSAIFVFLSMFSLAGQSNITGIVFNDGNGNGKPDKNEDGIGNVVISDGTVVVATDASGKFSFPVSSNYEKRKVTHIFISLPSAYLPISNTSWFHEIAPQNNEKEYVILFPLKKSETSQNDFNFIHFSDTHLLAANPVMNDAESPIYKYCRKNMAWDLMFNKYVPEMIKRQPVPAFLVDTGDIALRELSSTPEQDALSYRKRMNKLTEKTPVFSVPGNHDGLEFGKISPLYYSFSWGQFHFVCLNSTSEVSDEYLANQRAWLKKDLDFCPSNTPVIIFIHRPFDLKDQNGKAFYSLIKNYNIKAVLYGDQHALIYYKKEGIPHLCPNAVYSGIVVNWLGYPPGYSNIRINGSEIGEITYKSLESEDTLVPLVPKDGMVVTGMPYPYWGPFNEWDGRVRCAFLSFDSKNLTAVEYRLDSGAWETMDRESLPFYQKWVGKKNIKKGLGTGRHILTFKATDKNSNTFVKDLSFYTGRDSIAGKNLFPNPSFEIPNGEKLMPEGWTSGKYNKNIRWDDQEKNTGKYSLRLSGLPRYSVLDMLAVPVPVDSSRKYNLSLYIKGKNITGNGYLLFSGMGATYFISLPTGTYDWRQVNAQIQLMPGAEKMGFIFANWNAPTTSGTLWIDDVELKVIE